MIFEGYYSFTEPRFDAIAAASSATDDIVVEDVADDNVSSSTSTCLCLS